MALEKVAGSIPVGDPPKFRIGKFKTIAADALRPNIVLSSAKVGRSTGSVNWISSMSPAESTVASSEYGTSPRTCSMTTSLWSSWCAVGPSVPPPRRCLARWCRRRPSHARAEQAPCPQFAQDRHIEPARSRGSRCALRLLIKYTIMYTISSSHEWHKVVRREPHGGWEQSRSAAPRKRR